MTIDAFFRKQMDVPDKLAARLFQTTCWICEYHQAQHRLSGELYLEHCFSVMGDILDISRDPIVIAAGGLPEEIIIAGGLHDMVEDTDVTLEIIAAVFGADVAYLVEGCTKKPLELFGGDVVARQRDLHLTILTHAARHYGVILIRLGCRNHNLKTIDGLALDRQLFMAQDTLDFYVPMLENEARRLVPVHLHHWLDHYAHELDHYAQAKLPGKLSAKLPSS